MFCLTILSKKMCRLGSSPNTYVIEAETDGFCLGLVADPRVCVGRQGCQFKPSRAARPCLPCLALVVSLESSVIASTWAVPAIVGRVLSIRFCSRVVHFRDYCAVRCYLLGIN